MNEILRVPERGFRRAKEFRMLGMDEAVVLSNPCVSTLAQ